MLETREMKVYEVVTHLTITKSRIPASHHGNVEAIGTGDGRERHEPREQRIHVL